jgi:hypothetical protein
VGGREGVMNTTRRGQKETPSWGVFLASDSSVQAPRMGGRKRHASVICLQRASELESRKVA